MRVIPSEGIGRLFVAVTLTVAGLLSSITNAQTSTPAGASPRREITTSAISSRSQAIPRERTAFSCKNFIAEIERHYLISAGAARSATFGPRGASPKMIPTFPPQAGFSPGFLWMANRSPQSQVL